MLYDRHVVGYVINKYAFRPSSARLSEPTFTPKYAFRPSSVRLSEPTFTPNGLAVCMLLLSS